jgi:hypothetical protein
MFFEGIFSVLVEYSKSSIFLHMQLELKLGLGGTSYEDFIRTLHLPLQLRCFEEPISR